MVSNCVVPGCRSQRREMKQFCVPFTNKPRWFKWIGVCPFLKRYRFNQLENVRICKLHFLPEHINEKDKLTIDAIPTLKLPFTANRQQIKRTDQSLYLEISPNTANNDLHNFTILRLNQINTCSESVPTTQVSDDKSGKVLPRKNFFLNELQSKPLHELKECIAPEEDRISEQVESNLVHISQDDVASESHTISGQEQNCSTVHKPQECLAPENYTLSGQVQNKPAQGSIVLKTYSKQVQSEPIHNIPQEIVVPEKETVPYPEPVNIMSANVELDEQEHIDHDDVPDNLSMHCDDGDTASVAAQYTNGIGRHEEFHCDICKGDIVGFRYTCVQCSSLDLCIECESSGAHAHHYMLRIPRPRPFSEIQTILAMIRRNLMRELDPIKAPEFDNEDAISVKSDIKSENEDAVEEVEEMMNPLYENMSYDDLNEESRFFSPGSEDSKNKDCEEILQNNPTIQQQVRVQKVIQSSFIRTSDENKSTTPPSTAKRKIILTLAEFLKLKESNKIPKMCLMPSTKKKEINVVPTTSAPELNAFNPTVKLLKQPPRDVSEQEQIGKKICFMPGTRIKNVSLISTALAPKPMAFNPVVKITKLPPNAVSVQEQMGFTQVRPLNSLQNIMNTYGNR